MTIAKSLRENKKKIGRRGTTDRRLIKSRTKNFFGKVHEYHATKGWKVKKGDGRTNKSSQSPE